MQSEILMKQTQQCDEEKKIEKEKNFNKQLLNKSLRKCRGHKPSKSQIYNNNQCNICGSYKY